MRFKRIEQKKRSLQQALIFLIMVAVSMMVYLAHDPENGLWMDVLAIVCLATCLYVVVMERKLNNREASLLQDLVKKDSALDYLRTELVEGRYELEEKREKADEVEGRLKEITMLYRAIDKVNAEPHNDKVTSTTLRSALELVGGDRGSIMLLDKDKRYLWIDITIGADREIAQLSGQKVGEGVAGWVAEYGKPLLINGDAQDDDRFYNLSKHAAQINSAVCVPLNLRNETIGVMNIGITEPGRREFTDYHMSLATIFCQHASVAIMQSILMCSLSKEDVLQAH